jgi:uncharacterized protein YukE
MAIAEDMKKITDNIIASYDVRVRALGDLVADTRKTLKDFAVNRKKMSKEQAKALADFVADLSKNVSNMIKTFQKEHNEMANKLKADLAKGEENRLKDFKSMMAGIQKAIKEIETYVKNKLKEFDDAHADMSEALKKELAKYVADIVSQTKKLLGGFRDEREKMAANWQALTATMAKRRGLKPRVEAGVKVRPVEEAIEKAKPKKKAKKKKKRKKSEVLSL